MKPKVVITHWVHPEVIDFLAGECEVVSNATRETLPRKEIVGRCRGARGIMVFMPDSLDEAFLRACPDLKIVSAALKGYDNFDVQACTRRGVWFTIVKESLTAPTAELAIALLLGIIRRVPEGDHFIRSGNFRGWRPQLYGTGLAGRTLGIIGMGAVGRAVARRAAGFEMKVLYQDLVLLGREEEEALRVSRSTVGEILEKSDFVMPLLPLNPDTFHLIDSRAIARMKPGSYLINVCRGSVVDEEAVARALRSGPLAGYAADVFEMEDWARADRPRSIPRGLLENTAQTLFTPHLGSAVDEIRRGIALEAAAHILQALKGQKPDGAVNSLPLAES